MAMDTLPSSLPFFLLSLPPFFISFLPSLLPPPSLHLLLRIPSSFSAFPSLIKKWLGVSCQDEGREYVYGSTNANCLQIKHFICPTD